MKFCKLVLEKDGCQCSYRVPKKPGNECSVCEHYITLPLELLAMANEENAARLGILSGGST